ncbi:AER246Wp [Eremothecium gossypii ATCC 10895]|uniref:Cytochrome c lysine N-methyltransferase 1 n=1 Tax=Eremothecium gossypii (strain ATCC 10895 / CBS 109.51 / FGSC 9923 / NRRL Y-1056) TaxID=284811 RepID=CTM1_EREGS|nr:AER246Wp [Eremothecium gossypii ATCC 10895]Q756K8.1 RecName: Full=Cytochrome c lysine N-methyltransferase 1 [Eremothecium gossypii ATCC 10895]AAS52927.1 AER246Wp [Eremothecium gossypii ATCC 10895]AEY97235.1 FAER246Wp [Eremothecium gossypii FDAG1]
MRCGWMAGSSETVGIMDTADWYIGHGQVTVAPCVSIERSQIKSPDSGYGVFVDVDKLQEEECEAVELLRVPYGNVISVRTLMDWLSGRGDGYDASKDLIKTYLALFLEDTSNHRFVTETNMLILYLALMAILSERGYGFPDKFVIYLRDVLLQTRLLTPVLEVLTQEAGDAGAHYRNGPQEIFLSTLLQFISGAFMGCTRAVVLRVYAAVLSRCLEIPHETSPGSEDYTVSSSLVPILDFTNHSCEHRNAYFDVDRESGDVLLMLDVAACAGLGDRFEVFISYCPVEELVHFKHTYGFFPRASCGTQFWHMFLSDTWLKEERAPHGSGSLFQIYSELRVLPYIELALISGQVYVNDYCSSFPELLLPFVNIEALSDKESKLTALKGDQQLLAEAKTNFLSFLARYLDKLVANGPIRHSGPVCASLRDILLRELELSKRLRNTLQHGSAFLSSHMADTSPPYCPSPAPSPPYAYMYTSS